jgi:hypothetical protein
MTEKTITNTQQNIVDEKIKINDNKNHPLETPW